MEQIKTYNRLRYTLSFHFPTFTLKSERDVRCVGLSLGHYTPRHAELTANNRRLCVLIPTNLFSFSIRGTHVMDSACDRLDSKQFMQVDQEPGTFILWQLSQLSQKIFP